MDKPFHFKVVDNGTYYTVENTKARDFDNYHTHLTKKRKKKNMKKGDQYSWELLIDLVCKKKVPRSPYLRVSAKRISRDQKYIQEITRKQQKDRNKQRFHKMNNY